MIDMTTLGNIIGMMIPPAMVVLAFLVCYFTPIGCKAETTGIHEKLNEIPFTVVVYCVESVGNAADGG